MPYETIHGVDWIACRDDVCVVEREGAQFRLTRVESVDVDLPAAIFFDNGIWIANPAVETPCEIWYTPVGKGPGRYLRARKRIRCPGGVTLRKPEEEEEYPEEMEMVRLKAKSVFCVDETPADLARRGHMLLSCTLKFGEKETKLSEIRWLSLANTDDAWVDLKRPLRISAEFPEPTDCMYMKRPGYMFGYDLACVTDVEASDLLTESERTLRGVKFK